MESKPMDSKLTLRLNADKIEQAKRYAAQRGSSVSQLVEDYFSRLYSPPSAATIASTSLTAQLRGVIGESTAHLSAYKSHLDDKYK